jgi:hypothetical protein
MVIYRRVLVALSGLVLLFPVLAAPALARSIVVAKQSTRTAASLLFSVGLIPTQRYSIDIRSPHHRSFTGLAVENFTYINRGSLGTGVKTVTLTGTTPKTFQLPLPKAQGQITSWNVELSVQLRTGKGLTARVVDTGGK